jgi:uncharacterized SAM-binding protein YcdF (DUF218 family)
MNILIILLGCHISILLNDRIETAIQFVNKLNQPNQPNQSVELNVDWFLSGGIKNPQFDDQLNEADKMSQIISTKSPANSANSANYANSANSANYAKWSYIKDTIATNTAENFIMASKYIETNNDIYDKIYVVTSDFHYLRAKAISDLINPSNNYEWILGKEELNDSRYWEKIHMKNVKSDVDKALNKYKNIK